MDEYNDIYHHGVKGQKWGVRRYQNKDGTLTSAGKARRGQKKSNAELFDRLKDDKDDSKWVDLYWDITSKSGNWIKRHPVSKEFKKTLKEWSAESRQIEDKYKHLNRIQKKKAEQNYLKYRDKFAGVALKDLGYEDTEAGRRFLIDNGLIYT